MVTLNKIVTKAGDGGLTRLATGEEVAKSGARIDAIGAVDETNCAIGVARLHVSGALDVILARVQNDLFDLGADLATPHSDKLGFEPLRVSASQVTRIEHELDALNANHAPLTSFVLPGGSRGAAHLHLARALARRAERAVVRLSETEAVSPVAVRYANRLSDLLFVCAREANDQGQADVLWVPGENR
jgi:cob(I)alamin adenosyltransferase